MEALDVVFAVGFGVVAVLTGASGIAMLRRSRHQPDAIVWRGHRLGAPRLAGSMWLFVGLGCAARALSIVFLERGGVVGGLMFLAGMTFFTLAIVTGVRWFLRRGKTAQQPETQ